MVTEIYIINSKKELKNPNVCSFNEALSLISDIGKIFLDDDCNWSASDGIGNLTIYGYYKTDLAELKIYIAKINKSEPYILQLTVYGGKHPLAEVSRLCLKNGWTAYNLNTASYLDLNNPKLLNITSEDRERYNQNFNDLINGVTLDYDENHEETHIAKKWWQFWK